MPIQKIRIKNFRSLSDISIDVESLAVFVGCNDAGKSNILRALDLFFNGAANKYRLDWIRDFSGFAKPGQGKAKEIQISLTFKLPESYNVKGRVIWSKTWRQLGFHHESILQENGTELPPRSKAVSYLRSIRYEYVPAIKGPDYFEKLLGSVYDMLESTAQQSIRSASASFTDTIRRHTIGILADLSEQLGLSSDLTLPTDLRDLFSALEFRSQTGVHSVALAQRGDGIKVRHIPIILNWMARQANHERIAVAGRPRVETIWGYEEPENNLEARSAFELADSFLDLQVSGIQIFLTTHSPIFYSGLLRTGEKHVCLHEVQKELASDSRIIRRDPNRSDQMEALDSSVGFLHLIEPHIKEWRERVDSLKIRITQLVDTSVPTVFVEGPTDKRILQAVFNKYYNEHTVQVLCSTQNGGGHEWVRDSLIAWHYSRPNAYAVGLFDNDRAAKPSYDAFHRMVHDAADGKTKTLALKLPFLGLALDIKKQRICLDTAIEEICPREAWLHAQAEEWCEVRTNLIATYGFNETGLAFDEWIDQKLNDNLLGFIARHKIKQEFKEKFSKLIAKWIAEDSQYNLAPLERVAKELLTKLRLVQIA